MSSQGAKDAIADARTLVVIAQPRPGSALAIAQGRGSRAVVACLDGAENLAALNTRFAAHAAFKAVGTLRG